MLSYETAIILINLLAVRIQELENLLEKAELELERAESIAIEFENKIRHLEEKIKKQGEQSK